VAAVGRVVGLPVRGRRPRIAEVTLDAKEIHELIEILSRSSLTTLEIEREGFRLRLEKNPLDGQVPTYVMRAPEAVAPTVPMMAPPAVAAAPAPAAPAAAADPLASAPPDGSVELRSPFVGTFYRAPSPDANPFVEIGGKVRKGQVVCIVEAMKLMNEIEAEVEGEMVGFIAADVKPAAKLAWIATFCVAPGYRRRGIGSELLKTCEERLEVPSVRLSVRASNQEAIRLYLSFGYQKVGLWRDYYQDREDALVMEKALPQ
jgi:acetyl-CoA carboxylase biotin carboxyl carrier protein